MLRTFRLATAGHGVAGSTLVVLAGSAVALGASLVLRMVLARVLAPAEVGLLLLGIGVVSTAGGIASLGLNPVAARDIARLRWAGRPRAAWGLARRVATVAAGAGALAAVLLALGATEIAPFVAREGDPERFGGVLRGLAPVVLALPLGLAGLGIYRALGGVLARALVRDGGGGLLRLALAATAAVAVGTPKAIALAYGAAVLASEGLFLAHGLRRARSEATAAPPEPEPAECDPGRPSKLAPFVWMELLGQAQQWFDLLVVGLFVSPRDLAPYALARALARALDMARLAAAHRFLPAASERAVADPALRRLHRHTVGVVLALVAVPAVVFLVWPAPVMEILFGDGYGAAGPLLALLTVSVLLEALTGFRELLLVARGREGQVGWLRGLCLGVGVALALVLVPRFGTEGAAWAVLGAQLVRSAGLLALSRRRPQPS